MSTPHTAVSPVGLMKRVWRSIIVHLPPRNFITLHYLYFIGTCLLTSVVFWGSSTESKRVSFIDSLFLTVSAMTEAGLNTVNLSELNSFQQSILFVLIILGSAIFVSLLVVHVRRSAFETRFRSIIEDQHQQRKERSRGNHRSSLSRSRSRKRAGKDPEAVGVLGEPVKSTYRSDRPSVAQERPPVAEYNEVHDRLDALSDEDNPSSGPVNEDRFISRGDGITRRSAHIPTSEDDGINRRITFSSHISPSRESHHTRVFSMQGVGARQDGLNHPSQSSFHIYPSTSSAEIEAKLETLQNPIDYPLPHGSVGRNSQFSHLTLADRERLGGVEYRAITFLAVIVPMYFILWQLLGSLGLGAYVARNRADVTRRNGLNPWWVGAFNAISAFNNSGLSLLDMNMFPFQSAYYKLITMGLLILAGNTCYPIFLRLIIWAILQLLPENERFQDLRVTLRFLLDHPRRCYTTLFPSSHTWWLLGVIVCLNGIDWVAFEVLNIGNPSVSNLPAGVRAIDGLFQALAVRSGGFYIIPMSQLRIGLLILYVVMMYISVYPIVITMRNSNIYEERSLGIYANDPDETLAEARDHSRNHLSCRLNARRGGYESRGYFIRQQLRGQLAHDLWWIVLAVLFITITETSQFERDPITFSVFNVIFEVISAYGCVGISVGLPDQNYSFSGGWHVVSKLILCAVMIRGRHRGLPVAIDRAVLLPGEHLAAAEEEDAQIRLERSLSRDKGHEAV